jgi:hypothetical protein
MGTGNKRRKEMSDNSSRSGGIGICGATFIVFLVLKLTNVINWSWWWVAAQGFIFRMEERDV